MESQTLFTGQELPSLRKPKITEDEPDTVPTDPDKTQNDNIISKSKLSVDAKEFFPKGYLESGYFQTPQNNIPPKSVQSRLARPQPVNNVEITESPSIAEMVAEPFDDGYQECQELEHLREVLFLLTLNPGKFDDTVPALIENLKTYVDNKPMVDTIVSSIVEQAIEEHNFGYSGARLSVILNTCSPFFRDCLINCCAQIQFNAENNDKARNYTLFLAELFSQLNWDESFGLFLLKMLDDLLIFNAHDDIKCICQTLKLTGMSLEALNFDRIRNIIDRLRERQSSLPTSYANLLNSVLELRAAQWGRGTPHHTTSNNIAPLAHTDYPPESPIVQRWSDGGPVFYGPDGLELSAEENAFLTNAADEVTPDDSFNFCSDDSDPDAWDPDPELDEEIGRAFKEFVAMNKK